MCVALLWKPTWTPAGAEYACLMKGACVNEVPRSHWAPYEQPGVTAGDLPGLVPAFVGPGLVGGYNLAKPSRALGGLEGLRGRLWDGEVWADRGLRRRLSRLRHRLTCSGVVLLLVGSGAGDSLTGYFAI